METVTIVEILPKKVWIESGICGERAVMVQHEGDEPFEYAVFNYDYRHTSNAVTLHDAESLAKSLGATDPVERRNREYKLPPPPATQEDDHATLR